MLKSLGTTSFTFPSKFDGKSSPKAHKVLWDDLVDKQEILVICYSSEMSSINVPTECLWSTSRPGFSLARAATKEELAHTARTLAGEFTINEATIPPIFTKADGTNFLDSLSLYNEPRIDVLVGNAEILNRDLLDQIKKLEQTPEEQRWPEATWPDAQAFKDAEIFARKLPLNEIPVPDVGLADDGEVNFLWKQGDVHVDLGFYGTGAYSYFAQGEDGRSHEGEEISASEGLPREIVALFTTP